MSIQTYYSDTVIIGAGIAGITCALELLDAGQTVILVDRQALSAHGGLAKESFGGINIIDSPIQRWNGIKDSPELAYEDWCHFAEFDAYDCWPRAWARFYTEASRPYLYDWLRAKGIPFFPIVHWVERGLFKPGNSVPRFHMVWGTGKALIDQLWQHLFQHKHRDKLHLLFEHTVQRLLMEEHRMVGCLGHDSDGRAFEILSDTCVIASGGFGGNLDWVRSHWDKELSPPPHYVLNGSDLSADGSLHAEAARHGAMLTHLEHQWIYAAGVHHPRPRHPHHGLSLIPPHSALWVNAKGERFGPMPLVTSFDNRFLVSTICHQEKAYSWQIMNLKIAERELAVSGADYNDDIRDKNFFGFLRTVLLGNKKMLRELMETCQDFVVANDLEDLVTRMNALNGDQQVSFETLRHEILQYDRMIDRGPQFFNDEQLRRIAQLRNYRGDRVRTCRFQKILDPKAGPLLAIREFILSRKSLGGLQTNLYSQALDSYGEPIGGLYAIGEAAGFGGGGIHGKRALEGTFLGSCILTARCAARHIGRGTHLGSELLTYVLPPPDLTL